MLQKVFNVSDLYIRMISEVIMLKIFDLINSALHFSNEIQFLILWQTEAYCAVSIFTVIFNMRLCSALQDVVGWGVFSQVSVNITAVTQNG